jgi:hypothetical protein
MSRTRAALLCLLLAAPAAAGTVRQLDETVAAGGIRRITIDFPVGQLRVEAAPAGAAEVTIDLAVDCRRGRERCRERAERVRLETRQRGDHLAIEVSGYPKTGNDDMHVEGTITIPTGRSLAIDMGVGELEVAGVDDDLSIDLGVGEVDVSVPEARFRSVDLDAGIGEASLRLPEGRYQGRRSFLIGSELDWHEGRGQAALVVDLGVGEVEVRLRD